MSEIGNQKSEIGNPPDYRLRLPALHAYRAAAGQRRALAFCDLPEFAAGLILRPLTLPALTILLARGNRFLRAPGTETLDDVLDYLWVHAPTYRPTTAPGWRRAKRRHLAPFLRALTSPLRYRLARFCWRLARPRATPGSHSIPTPAEHAAAVLTLAILEIRALLATAFADAGAPLAAPPAPIATLEAHFIHNLHTAYGWSTARIRATPLKQLFQLDRCQRRAAGETIADAGEHHLIAAHLARRQSEIDRMKSAPDASDKSASVIGH